MDSIKVCLTFRNGRKLEKVYVKVVGASTLFGVLGAFAWVWFNLCKTEGFSDHLGYLCSIVDADNIRVKPDYVVEF